MSEFQASCGSALKAHKLLLSGPVFKFLPTAGYFLSFFLNLFFLMRCDIDGLESSRSNPSNLVSRDTETIIG